MNFRRILANAVARRVAVLLVAAALAWLGIGQAEAACTLIGGNPSGGFNNGDWSCGDEGEAYAKVASMGIPSRYASCGMINVRVVRATSFTYTQRMTYPGGTCGIGYQQDIATGSASFPQQMTCSSRPNFTTEFYPKSGSISCQVGCEMAWFRNSDGTSTAYATGAACTNEQMPQSCTGDYYWNPILNVCEPMTPECPAGQALNSRGICGPEECPAGMKLQADNTCGPAKEECPAGNIKAPSGECLPGEGQCAAGEARRENGTCGKDSDGDGKADEDDDNPDNDPDKESASGGDTCDAPPSCSGGAIDCMQVKIQWRIDCNTRKNRNVSGGTCGAVPVCTGDKCDALEYASLLQQWRTACHLEKLANSGLPGGGTGSGSNAMDPVSSDGVLGDDLDPSTVQRGFGGSWNGEGDELAFDESGYGFARTCPTPPTLDVLGKSITFDTSVFCDWMRLGGVFVMIMAYLAGLSIVVRS